MAVNEPSLRAIYGTCAITITYSPCRGALTITYQPSPSLREASFESFHEMLKGSLRTRLKRRGLLGILVGYSVLCHKS